MTNRTIKLGKRIFVLLARRSSLHPLPIHVAHTLISHYTRSRVIKKEWVIKTHSEYTILFVLFNSSCLADAWWFVFWYDQSDHSEVMNNLSAGVNRLACMKWLMFSLSESISERFLVPRTLRSVVWARRRVDLLASSTFVMEIVAFETR